MSKNSVINEILLQNYTVKQAIHYCKRGMMKRVGPDVLKDWTWDLDRLRFYELKELQKVLEELKKENDGLELQSSTVTQN